MQTTSKLRLNAEASRVRIRKRILFEFSSESQLNSLLWTSLMYYYKVYWIISSLISLSNPQIALEPNLTIPPFWPASSRRYIYTRGQTKSTNLGDITHWFFVTSTQLQLNERWHYRLLIDTYKEICTSRLSIKGHLRIFGPQNFGGMPK